MTKLQFTLLLDLYHNYYTAFCSLSPSIKDEYYRLLYMPPEKRNFKSDYLVDIYRT
jgi:hypothetical protein